LKILGIDTSSSKLSLALVENSQPIADLKLNLEQGHSRYLILAIGQLFKKAKISLDKINVLALSLGPGSFTGLRIGATTIKAIAIAKRKKIVAVPSLDVLAYNGLNEQIEYICPIIDAKKNKIYTAIYRKSRNELKKQTKDLLISVQDLLRIINKPTLFLGDGLKIYKGEIAQELNSGAVFADEKLWFPQAKFVAILGEKMARKNKFIDPLDLVPLYLHKRDCQVK
jgi:tRNA threonylcarbamoyladenosine biosynthesis protein TsaB